MRAQDRRRTRVPVLAAVAAAAIVVGAGIAGCSSGSGAAHAHRDLTLGPISLAVGQRSPALDQAVQQWNSTHPAEQVSITTLPADPADRRDALVENLQNDTPGYDVVATDLTATAELAAQHRILPLTGDLAVATSGLVAPAVAVGAYHGEVYAAPLSVAPGVLFYRTDLLRNAPRTWTALTAACASAQRVGMACFSGQYSQGADLAANLDELIVAAGGTVLASDGTRAQLDSPQARAALQFLADSYRRQVIPPAAITYQQQQSIRAFSSGALMMLRATPEAWAQLSAQTSEVRGLVGIAALPGQSAPAPAVYDGTGLALNSSGKHLRSGAAFISYLLNGAVQRSMLVDNGQPPALAQLYDDPSLRTRFPFLAVLQQGFDAAEPAPVTPAYADLSSDLATAAYSAVTGAKSAEQASNELQTAATGLPLG